MVANHLGINNIECCLNWPNVILTKCGSSNTNGIQLGESTEFERGLHLNFICLIQCLLNKFLLKSYKSNHTHVYHCNLVQVRKILIIKWQGKGEYAV